MTKSMSLQQLVGYLRTWSSYNSFKKQHPSSPDPMDIFEQEVLQAYRTTDTNHSIVVSFPIFLILAKRPS